MARRKLPEDQKLQTVGVNLSAGTIERLDSLAKEMEMKPSLVARELLLLGLAIIETAGNNQLIRERVLSTVPDKDDLIPVYGGNG